MSEKFQVPKHEVSARALLPGGEHEELKLYVSERAERHSGRERPSDLLNRDDRFVPVRLSDSGFVLLRRTAVLVMVVSLEDELVAGVVEGGEGPDAEGAERHEVRLVLDEGTEVEGSVTYVMPPGEQRLQDYLNQAPGFVRVRDGDRIQLVNTGRIVRVEPL